MKPWGGRYCSLTLPPPHAHSRHPHRTHTTPQRLPPPAFSVVRRLSPPPADAAACIPFAFSLILSSPSNHRSRWPSPAFFLSPLPPWRRRLSFPPLSCPYRSVRGSWTRTPLDSPLACTLPSTHGAMWSRGRPLAPTPTRVLCGCICRTHTVEGGGGHTFPSTEVWQSPPHLRYSAQVCHIGS